MELDVLTINLWGTQGPVDTRMTRLAAYLASERPDVVAFQEVDEWRGRPQAHQLGEAAGYTAVHYERSGRESRPGEGLAILTSLDSDAGELVALPDSGGNHPRAMQQADVVTGDGTVVRVVNTHLTWQLDASDARTMQARRIREELTGWTGPVVLLGDLNDVVGSAPLDLLTGGEGGFEPLTDAYAAANDEEAVTFDLANSYLEQPQLANRRIDHVLVRGFDVESASVVMTGSDAPIVSDHYGVRALLRDGGRHA